MVHLQWGSHIISTVVCSLDRFSGFYMQYYKVYYFIFHVFHLVILQCKIPKNSAG